MGTPIPPGVAGPVDVKLNVGSPETQVVKVQAEVSLTVVIPPENGPSSRYDATIPKTVTGNTSVASVNVNIPLDTVCHVHVWTR